MTEVLLKAKDLCKSYASDGLQTHVLNHMDLEINEKDFTVIMGSSGSGKSTLLYCLSGMDNITSGEVFYKDKLINKMRTKQLSMLRRKDFGFVFQESSLVSNLSLFENVAVSGYLCRDKSVKEVNKKTEELLKAVGIGDVKKHLPTQVSGGQKQRASIARALITSPEIIFADEPTGALNSKSGQEVLDLLTMENKKGQTILMVTHDIKAAVRANRLLYIEDGRIVGELSLSPYEEEERKSREVQILSWLSKKGW